MLTNIKKIEEIDNVNIVNAYLKEGWKLLQIFEFKGKAIYIIGLI